MKRSRLYIATLIAISSLTILQSCEQQQLYPDCEGLNRPPEYYKLSEGQKAILPYTGYDTISMVSNMGDTIHCIGTGKQYFNTMEFEESGIALCASYGTELYYEAYKIEFIDTYKNVQIDLSHFRYNLINDKKRANDVQVVFAGAGFCITDWHISNKGVQSYVGDAMVQGIICKDANKVPNYTDRNDTLSYMLINRSQGILKMQISNIETWERVLH